MRLSFPDMSGIDLWAMGGTISKSPRRTKNKTSPNLIDIQILHLGGLSELAGFIHLYPMHSYATCMLAMCTTEKYDIDYFSCDCYSQRQIPKNPCEVEIATAMTIIRIITIDGSIDYIDDIMVMLLDH